MSELYGRLDVRPGRLIGVIHLDQITDQAVPLSTLRAHGIPFARNMVSGRTLSLEEVAAVLVLGGLAISSAQALVDQAAEAGGPFAS